MLNLTFYHIVHNFYSKNLCECKILLNTHIAPGVLSSITRVERFFLSSLITLVSHTHEKTKSF
jgi:hypothetical protein